MPDIKPLGVTYTPQTPDNPTTDTAAAQEALNLVIETLQSQGGPKRTSLGSSGGAGGTGGSGGAGDPPPIPPPNVQASDADSFVYMFMALQSKALDAQLNYSKTDIGVRMDKQKAANEDRIVKLKEAAEAASSASKGGLFGKIFGWIGVALSLVAALAATVVSGGAALPLLIGAVLGATVMVLGETGVMGKIVDALANAMSPPMSEEKAKMWAGIIVGVGTAVLMIGATMASGGLSSSALAGTVAQKIADMIKIAATIGSGLAQVGKGASTITTAAYSFESANAQADALQFSKTIAKLQAVIEDEMKRIEDILKKMDEGVATMMQIFSDQASTKDFINQRSAA
ncbi:MAG: type III secretion system translocon subunit SctE [Candidatus Methylacidiphilales bacterium]|nr:type III secretion system translocon subunit SctE [Candidatus Methylacidiphilales bacterium]